MSPQPAAPAKSGNQQAPTNGQPKTAQDMSPFVDGLIEQADALHTEKTALFERIAASRDMLRNLVKTGAATAEQRDRIEKLYKTRERKAKASA